MIQKNRLGSAYLHENEDFLVTRSRIHGYGLFAKRTFGSEERVLDFTGDLYDAREMPILLNDPSYDKENDKFIQVNETLFLGPYMRRKGVIQFDDFVNHSCSPNTLVRSPENLTLSLFARRKIKP